MTKVHIVNHTHWDREWYFTSADSLVLSEQLFTDVIDELNANPEASFVLDGQISILDDYVALYPEKLDMIKKLVSKKQLFIGPWYTQTDAFYVSGESILRNIMVGVFESRKYGEYLPIGYLPDTFGFNAQMPLLLKESGFDNIFFWRGIHLGKHVQSPYFKWASLNGENQIIALNMPQGYGTGMLLEPTENYVAGRLDPAVDFIKQYTDTSEILIPSGNDQLNIITDFTKKVEEINQLGKYEYQPSSYQKFLEVIKKQEDLEVYTGEFREPVLARIHKTVGSSRMNIKLKLHEVEEKLIHRVEPLLVIAKKCGISFSPQLLINVWKKILEGQAHDSLAGCVSDAVMEDIIHRLKEASEMLDSIENTIMKKLAEGLGLTESEILMVNTDLKDFSGYKKVGFLSKKKEITFLDQVQGTIIKETYVSPRENILEETPAGNRFIVEDGYYILTALIKVDLPSLGYRVIRFTENEAMEQLSIVNEEKISNDYYQIFYENNSLTLLLKNGQEITDFIRIVDEGNAGDTYDFSPLENDEELELIFSSVECQKSSMYEQLLLKGSTLLPTNLSERKAGKKSTLLEFDLIISLKKDQQDIQGSLQVHNSILNHRLRLKLKTGFQNKRSHSSLPFGFIQRENQNIQDWYETYSERPVDINPFESTVSIGGDRQSYHVFTKGMKEFQYDEIYIYITLLATTDELGKPDLLYRPGRASGDTTKKGHIAMPTPKAQLLGTHAYEFVLRFDDHLFDEMIVAEWRHNLEQISMSYQLQKLNYFIHRIDNKIQQGRKELTYHQKELSLIKLPDNLLVSSCAPSYYDEKAVIVRIENPTSQTIKLNSEDFSAYNAYVINVLEEIKDEQVLEIASYSFITLKLLMKK